MAAPTVANWLLTVRVVSDHVLLADSAGAPLSVCVGQMDGRMPGLETQPSDATLSASIDNQTPLLETLRPSILMDPSVRKR